MPKAKATPKTSAKSQDKAPEKKTAKPAEELEKIIEIDTEEKEADLELIPGDLSEDDTEDDDAALDEEEIDPFKDKWEE